MLQTWRWATPLLFKTVDCIKSFRSLLILSNDVLVDLEPITLPAEVEAYPSKETYCQWKVVSDEFERVSTPLIDF